MRGLRNKEVDQFVDIEYIKTDNFGSVGNTQSNVRLLMS